jgi:hypothetical protein
MSSNYPVDQPEHPPLRTNSPCNGSDFPGQSAGAHGFSRAGRSGQEKVPPRISAEETSQLWKLPNIDQQCQARPLAFVSLGARPELRQGGI